MKNINYTEITKEEKELLNKLDLVTTDIRTSKILEYIVESDYRLNELLIAINEKLKEHIEGKKYVKYYYDIDSNIIDNLNMLKEEIRKYKREQYTNNKTQEKELIEKCLSTLSDSPFRVPYFFNNFLVTKNKDYLSNDIYNFNKDTINKLYDILSNDDNVEEIIKGTELINDKNKYENIIGKCEVSLSFKDMVLKNSNQIVEFNNTVKEIENLLEIKKDDKYIGLIPRLKRVNNTIDYLESNYLRRLVNKSRLEKLHEEKNILLQYKEEEQKIDEELIKLHVRLSKVNMELKDKGLSDLIARSDMKYILNNNDDEYAITSNLKKFYSKDDINNYFSNIEREYYEKKGLLESIKYEEQEFIKNGNKEVLDLINNDIDTANDISKLYNKKDNNINPKYAILVLKELLETKELSLKEMNIKDTEYHNLKTYFDVINDDKITEFSKDYIKALQGKSYRRK